MSAPTEIVIPSKEEIKAKLSSNQQWAERAIVYLYSQQTKSEQVYGETVEHNSVGFNSVDAEILSSFAIRLIKWNRPLTEKQLAIAFKKLPKYHKQIRQAIILNSNQ